MNSVETKLQYTVSDGSKSGIPVIIAAAGSSARMGGINKLCSNLCGIPVLARTLLAFENCDAVSRIIIAVRPSDAEKVLEIAEKYMITKLKDVVEGGESRQDSVSRCLDRLTVTDSKVLIHDGARPLVSDRIINGVVKALEENVAVTCAVKVKDTVKRVDGCGTVKDTLDRNELVAVQTPQGVSVSEYRNAVERAGALGCFTDDMSIMEACGYKVITVDGSYRNIKITTPEDLAVAEALLHTWEE